MQVILKCIPCHQDQELILCMTDDGLTWILRSFDSDESEELEEHILGDEEASLILEAAKVEALCDIASHLETSNMCASEFEPEDWYDDQGD